METSLIYIITWLLAGIFIIVLLTAKYNVHAFFALIISCFIVGLGLHLPLNEIIAVIKEGFGNIMKQLGLIIVLGTTLGVILEHSGSTRVMANYILKKVGQSRAPMAMSITGFIVGLPIFCDSGYIVLSGLNNSIARRTGISVAIMAVSLATGLYSVHCLIPPHPGAAAAAGILGVELGKLILAGIFVAIPAAISGYFWAEFSGKKIPNGLEPSIEINTKFNEPSVFKSFIPILVPIIIIGLKSIFTVEHITNIKWITLLISLGDPVIALSIGIILAFNYKVKWTNTASSLLLKEAAEKAGGILVIIGAGGAFGAILAASKIGDHLGAALPLSTLGIFFPFMLTSVLKTAQGSSTVAIITSSSIIYPLLTALGLATGNGPLLCILSMGAGSMMISHANDAYFWVIARFSGLDMKTMLRVYTISTICMGLTALLVVYILSKLL